MVTIKSYSYSRLVLGYGPDRGATVTVDWNSSDKAFRLIFGKQRTLFYTVALSLADEESQFDDNNAKN
jgi:mediator of RNA polymerase II transcription subunit 14